MVSYWIAFEDGVAQTQASRAQLNCRLGCSPSGRSLPAIFHS